MLVALALAVILIAGVILFSVFMFRNPATAATLRDIFLVVLGVQSMIIGLLLIAILTAVVYLFLNLHDLIHLVQTELRPIMQQADDPVRTVRSRAIFISDSAVKPVIEVMACVAAVKSIIRSFTRSEQ
jgi:predicted membrane protein